MTRIECSRPALVLSMALLAIWLTVLVAGLVGIYVADEYEKPAFSEQSVPPARLY